jgi:hypothetical protein
LRCNSEAVPRPPSASTVRRVVNTSAIACVEAQIRAQVATTT